MELADLKAKVGEAIGTSEWFLLDQERINRFADTTEDHQFIHVNPAAAAATPFGGTIAHGFLTLSMLAPMMDGAVVKPVVKMTVNYGFNKVRFLSPVKSGKRVRGHFKLVEATVEIEGEDKPALIAEWIFQHFA
jgi:acyl dehydratase